MDQSPLPLTSPISKGLRKKDWVIGIGIAIACIAVLFILANVALGNAVKPSPRGTANEIVIAIKGYGVEYNRFPLLGERLPVDSEVITSSGSLLNALMGDDDKINPRKIKFIDPPIAKNNVNGLLEKDGKRMLVDPWGKPYYILIDFDGDGKVPDPEHPGAMLDTTVIVFSGGPDGDPTTWQDNVRSWQ